VDFAHTRAEEIQHIRPIAIAVDHSSKERNDAPFHVVLSSIANKCFSTVQNIVHSRANQNTRVHRFALELVGAGNRRRDNEIIAWNIDAEANVYTPTQGKSVRLAGPTMFELSKDRERRTQEDCIDRVQHSQRTVTAQGTSEDHVVSSERPQHLWRLRNHSRLRIEKSPDI
jgi:hypothetical protein